MTYKVLSLKPEPKGTESAEGFRASESSGIVFLALNPGFRV